MKNKTINLLVADDHQIFLDGLEAALNKTEDIHLDCRCSNGSYAIATIEDRMNSDTPLDVIVVDINMPGKDGMEINRYVKKEFPTLKVIVLTMYNRLEYVRTLQRENVDGYLLKEGSIDELELAIRTVHQGGTYYSQAIMQRVMNEMRKNPNMEEPVLTKREIDVLKQIGLCKRTPEIAQYLNISPLTVDTHRRNIMHKLGLKNSLEIVRYALLNGFVPNES